MFKSILIGTLKATSFVAEFVSEELDSHNRIAGNELTVDYWCRRGKWVVYQKDFEISYDEYPEGQVVEVIKFKGAYDTEKEALANCYSSQKIHPPA